MFKMICEECESVMHWRCTNQITHIAKYKCPECGNVQTGPDTYKEPVAEKKIPNYYHIRNDRWKVTKTINKEKIYVGTYADEETAKLLSSEPYPLVMDAPLSAFDKRRIKAVCESLPKTAEQVIIFIKDR